MKKLATGVIIVASLLLAGCGTTNGVTKASPTACSKIAIPNLPQEEQLPEVRTLVPGKPYTPSTIQVAIPRSSWNLLQLYNKSLWIWIQSAVEGMEEHNKFVDQQLQEKKEEVTKKRGWFF